MGGIVAMTACGDAVNNTASLAAGRTPPHTTSAHDNHACSALTTHSPLHTYTRHRMNHETQRLPRTAAMPVTGLSATSSSCSAGAGSCSTSGASCWFASIRNSARWGSHCMLRAHAPLLWHAQKRPGMPAGWWQEQGAVGWLRRVEYGSWV
jgi:hypothetical protein